MAAAERAARGGPDRGQRAARPSEDCRPRRRMTRAHRHPRRHVRSDSLRPSRHRARRGAAALGLDAHVRDPVEHSAAPAAAARLRLSPLRDGGAGRRRRPDWRASDLELRTDAPSFTSTTLRQFHERGYAPSELFFVIGADAFAEIATWTDYPADPRRGTFRRRLAARARRSTELPRRLPRLASRMIAPPLDARRRRRAVDHFDRRADRRRVIHCDPRPASPRANRSPGWSRRRAATH